MRYCCDKEINRLVAKLVREGWSFTRGRHGKLRKRDGSGFVTVPITPSDRRSLLNLRSDIRRLVAMSLDADTVQEPSRAMKTASTGRQV
jgi:hypothetical protein